MRDALRQLSAELGVADRVHFVGWQVNMPGLMAAADLTVLTSRWEGIVLEAMFAARPIVTIYVHGARELLGAGAR
jgi:glycosyltransferase involved in cell wall biosynthesis